MVVGHIDWADFVKTVTTTIRKTNIKETSSDKTRERVQYLIRPVNSPMG
jgi:hypothetical protein